MRKDEGECFLCESPGKGKRFAFYSGVMKGGTTHELLSCTVTFFERWSDLTMHEIQVCRQCQLRLWRQQQSLWMVLCGIGGGVALSIALVGLVLPAPLGWVVAGVGAVAALALGGFFAFLLQQSRGKPKHAQLEPLVIREAIPKLPHDDHTYMTTDQYIERAEKGIIG